MRLVGNPARLAIAAALAAAAAGLVPLAPDLGARSAALALALGSLAAACAAIASPADEGGPVRLGLLFVVVATELLSPHLAFCVGGAALAAGGGGGLAGPRRRGRSAVASAAAGLAVAALVAPLLRRALSPTAALDLLRLAVVFGAVELTALALDAALRRPIEGRTSRTAAGAAASVAFEAATVPVAWLLAFLISGGRLAFAAILAGAVLLVQLALRRLDRALSDLRATNDSLAARLAELASLHAIGREMLSSLNPAKVLAVVERECRKILDVDEIRVSLVDPESGNLGVEHRWRAGEDRSSPPDADDDLATSVFLEKRPVRSVEAGSSLAVPLVVEDRVVGVLSVRSARDGAYDDAREKVLTTIAQQAAVAIENARRHELATVDSLTRLLDREYFERCLEAEYNRARRYGGTFAVLMMDLDDFKSINDLHGHLAGDRYLRALGASIRSLMRSADLACRCGGDEFCILLPETRLEGARAIAGRIRREVARLVVESDGASLRTTASIGIAVFPDHDGGALRSLLLRADQALYRAKREGRDHVSAFGA